MPSSCEFNLLLTDMNSYLQINLLLLFRSRYGSLAIRIQNKIVLYRIISTNILSQP